VADFVKIDSQRRLVILPKVCSWFPNDFVIKRFNSGQSASPVDCLRVIAPYLRPEPRATLIRLISDGTNPSVRFKNFNFRCKVLSLYVPTSMHPHRSSSGHKSSTRMMPRNANVGADDENDEIGEGDSDGGGPAVPMPEYRSVSKQAQQNRHHDDDLSDA
jgi:hypothetical protein